MSGSLFLEDLLRVNTHPPQMAFLYLGWFRILVTCSRTYMVGNGVRGCISDLCDSKDFLLFSHSWGISLRTLVLWGKKDTNKQKISVVVSTWKMICGIISLQGLIIYSIFEALKSHILSWRPRKASDVTPVWVPKPENGELVVLRPSPGAGEDNTRCLSSRRPEEKGVNTFFLAFCSVQAFNGSNNAHSYWTWLSWLIQMLILLGNTLADTPTNNV